VELPDVSYPANPAGRGFCISPDREAIEELALPQIEWPQSPLTPEELVRDVARLDLSELEAPAGFAPLPVSWFPRAAHAGVMPWDLEAAVTSRDEALDAVADVQDEEPDWVAAAREQPIPVMRPGWYQDAHPALQVERVLGDERVTLGNLTRHGTLSFDLPGRHPWVMLEATGVDDAVALTLDTVHLDIADDADPHVHLVWRGFQGLASAEALANASDVKVTLRDLPQAMWLVRRQELMAGADEADDHGPAVGGTRVTERVGRDGSDE